MMGCILWQYSKVLNIIISFNQRVSTDRNILAEFETDNVNIMRRFLWDLALFIPPNNIVLIVMEERGHKTSLAPLVTDKRSTTTDGKTDSKGEKTRNKL